MAHTGAPASLQHGCSGFFFLGFFGDFFLDEAFRLRFFEFVFDFFLGFFFAGGLSGK